MRLVTYQPYRSLQHEINRMFDDVFGQHESGQTSDWAPSVDIGEEKDAYVIHAELPGVSSEDVKLQMENNVLTLSGEKTREEKTEDKTYHRFERTYGSFQRVFSFPAPVNAEAIEASYRDGVLTIRVPKVPKAETKEISISLN